MRYCLFGGKETSVSKKTDSSWHYGWDLTYAIHCTLPSDFASIILPGAVHSPFSCVKNALTLVSLDLLVSWWVQKICISRNDYFVERRV